MSDILMYTAQSEAVIQAIEKDGISFVKNEYIDNKYGEVSWIFRTAYKEFIKMAVEVVPKPDYADSPVWVYKDINYATASEGFMQLKLNIPKNEIILFDTRDWNRILNLEYLGDESEREAFNNKLIASGVKDPLDIFSKSFYPAIKSEVIKSWKKLFQKEKIEEMYLQGAVWHLKKEWIL